MHIVGDNGVAALNFNAYETGVGELAWIVESRLMQDALWSALQATDVSLVCPAQCVKLQVSDESAALSLSDVWLVFVLMWIGFVVLFVWWSMVDGGWWEGW